MNKLIINTVLPQVQIVLTKNEQIYTTVLDADKNHNEKLLGEIDMLLRKAELKMQDIDACLCFVGPGSFTGIRVGVATAKGFKDALGIKAYGINTLEYLSRLRRLEDETRDRLLLIPRLYTNKPRTRGEGYMGMLHQPDPDSAPDLLSGLIAIRSLHLRALADYGFTCADELLYPGERLICPGVYPARRQREDTGKPWLGNVAPASFDGGHVVVDVQPGGERYSVSYLTAADESMRVVSQYEFES